MFVILAYDVQQKRVAKVMKTVKKYLLPVQKSVFEGVITEGQLKHLQQELAQIVDPEKDSVVIYRLHSEKLTDKLELGRFKQEGRLFL